MMMKKALLAVATLVCCLVMLELGLRAMGRSPTNMADGIADQYGDSFRLKKNITKVMKFPAFHLYRLYQRIRLPRRGCRSQGPEGQALLCCF